MSPLSAMFLAITLGPQATLNDPHLIQKGLGGSVGLEVAPPLRLTLSGAGYLDRGEADWRPFTAQLRDENQITPLMTRMRWRAELGPEWTALRTRGRLPPTSPNVWEGCLGLSAGFGLVRTSDTFSDPLARDDWGDDLYFQTTVEQLQPTMNLGLFMELGGPHTRGRLGAKRVEWVDTFSATTLEMHRELLVEGAVVVRLGARNE